MHRAARKVSSCGGVVVGGKAGLRLMGESHTIVAADTEGGHPALLQDRLVVVVVKDAGVLRIGPPADIARVVDVGTAEGVRA